MATEPRNPDPGQPPPREREVIVTDGGRRSGMSGVIVAVLAIIVIAIVAVLVLNAIGGSDDVEMEAPEVDVPDEVDVNVDDGAS